VELALAEVVAAEHGEHAAVARGDRDEGGGRPGRIREPLPDRVARHLLDLEVDRRVDLQPPAEDPPRPVPGDELLLDRVREVLGRRRVACSRPTKPRPPSPAGRPARSRSSSPLPSRIWSGPAAGYGPSTVA